MFAIVYVGAIAVLFLFIVMMLNIREWKGERRDIWVVMSGMIMGSGILWILLGPALNAVETTQGASNLTKQISGWGSKIEIIPNIEEIGRVLYSGYRYEIIIVGVILLIGMIGAIILTLKVEEVDNRRDIITQIARKAEDVVYLVRR
jgi:NADH-quinone oxidoreductase subunit J